MRRLLLALVLCCAAAMARAQDAPPLALFADSITYESGTRMLVAEGNVEVYYQDFRLTAGSIRYGGSPSRIVATGPIRLEGPENTVILASLAELSPDFRDGLIQGARLILNRQFQVAAFEGRRTEGRYNTLYRTVATSCTVCGRETPPIWRIRAGSVVHDEVKKRLYFQDAFFDVFGLPLLYSPRLSIPAPGVKRASGLLVPSASTSNVYGAGAKFPVYFTLGDHADLTLTPFVTTTGTAILEGEYRQRFASGQMAVSGAFALDDGLGAGAGRGYISASGAFVLPRNYDLSFVLNQATDRSFLGQFGYSDADRLESFVRLSRNGDSTYFEARADAYQTLRDDEEEVQRQIPYVGPQVTYRKLWHGAYGTAGIEAGFLNLVREEGRDVIRGSAGADWTGSAYMSNGILVTGIADLDADLYAVRDDAEFDEDPVLRMTPSVGLELRWPFVREGRSAVQVIEPVAQLLYSETLGADTVPNEDSLLPEFGENNLFLLNRFPGRDARETGLRLNTGLTYTRLSARGWSIQASLGRVFKLEDDLNFYEGTGLRQASSDYVATLSLDAPFGLGVRGRSLFDDGLDFRRADLGLDYATDTFDASASYTFLSEDDSAPDLGFLERREEIALTSRYRFRPNWEMTGEWRYDLSASRSISAEGALTYGNECVEATLGLERRFTSSLNVPRDTRIRFEVNLLGFNAPSSQGWPARQCRGI